VVQTFGGYAAVGAVYFLISGLVILLRRAKSGLGGAAVQKG
jgi:hypothetical protein